MSQLVRMARAKKNPALKVAGVKFFTFKELSKATNQFDVHTEIGEGGYGKVYKATLEEEKKLVAIKRAQRESVQGANEFYTEIELLSRCHHRNLLRLVGYCDDEGEQMLVYEYMPGGNLRQQMESRLHRPRVFFDPSIDRKKRCLQFRSSAPGAYHRHGCDYQRQKHRTRGAAEGWIRAKCGLS